MLSVELGYLADMLDSTGQLANISSLARNYSSVISNAIWNTTVRILGHVYCYDFQADGSAYSGCRQYLRLRDERIWRSLCDG